MNAITVASAIAVKRPANHLAGQPKVIVDRSTDAMPVESEAVWSNADTPKPAYPATAKLRTQVGPKGLRSDFIDKDFLWCSRHADSPRHFECARLITADHIAQVFQRIPGFPVGANM